MIHTGLVSVTFRKLSPEEIIELVAKAGLDAIEWGGDIHVPHGDTETATRVGRLTEEAGLKVSSYGSYYRTGIENPFTFEQVLDTAEALKAPTIRVWAGDRGTNVADEEYSKKVIDDSRRIAELASSRGIKVSYEFHSHTLTDTNETAVRLLEAVGHDNMGTYWQPPGNQSHEQRLQGIRMISKWLDNIHVFYWVENNRKRPLAEGADLWKDYFAELKKKEGDRYALMEFVPGDLPEQFLEDAKAIKELCK